MSARVRPTIADILKIRSVAIVGISSRMGYYWIHSMIQWPHDLKLWLVSKGEQEALGRKVYQSLSEVPEKIDYAIISVPYKYVADVVKECAAKGAKGATIFTSGYSELGTEEGKQREKELGQIVRGLPMRVLGPNCMGLLYPKLGFAFMPTVKRGPGNVGFLSQSGGVAIATYTGGVESGLGFSKVFSFGNQIDITASEILDYFETDSETEAVGAYLEGAKDGKALVESLKRFAAKKPIVILKGGRSQEGTRVVSSHTGALAGNNELWAAAFRQANVPTVTTLEDLEATLSVFSKCPVPRSNSVGMVTISGGTSVIYTDLCIERGLKVPRTSPETVTKLKEIIKDVGTGIGNPVDMAADYYQDQTTSEVIRLVGADPAFDSIIIEADVHNIHQVATIMNALDVMPDFWKALAKASRQVVETNRKPVLVAVPEVAYPEQRTATWNTFVNEGLPVFRNVGEAVAALSRTCQYYKVRQNRSGR
jgi:acyl-CoA synthetase (NDP forming)